MLYCAQDETGKGNEMSNVKSIILSPNAERDIDFEITRQVFDILRKRNRRTVFCPEFNDVRKDGVKLSGLEPKKMEDELQSAEMIITFGGDGTILNAARIAAETGVPILGINLGDKGFMAELEAEDIGLIDSAATGDYKLEDRMMLDVEIIRDGAAICRNFALNDVVIRGDNKVIDLMLFGDGQRISRFSGDGAVIATPTGSTAYSMAAGGPIVEPAAQNIIFTPICAHILDAKSFVLASDRRVTVELGYKKHNPAYISVDGGNQESIQSGDVVSIFKSDRYTRLVRLSNRSFYKKVSEKLGERF